MPMEVKVKSAPAPDENSASETLSLPGERFAARPILVRNGLRPRTLLRTDLTASVQ
jgi:hypothetical protein